MTKEVSVRGHKKLIICFSGTFLENDAGGWLFIFYFFELK